MWTHKWLAAKTNAENVEIKITGIDISAAFDTIDRKALLDILKIIIDEDKTDNSGKGSPRKSEKQPRRPGRRTRTRKAIVSDAKEAPGEQKTEEGALEFFARVTQFWDVFFPKMGQLMIFLATILCPITTLGYFLTRPGQKRAKKEWKKTKKKKKKREKEDDEIMLLLLFSSCYHYF
ncbi:RxLR effector candidate protein [Elysia marginata]|uniref:RxLR effector candidate protein n=1 Tax=Elysia marginata TaxID=1093978 RepID=A0AAV4IIE7_9GAST|nr:RxLR effector candidate protein [Elysia marginata]